MTNLVEKFLRSLTRSKATTVVSKAINSAAKELTPCRAALPGGQGDGGCH